MRRALDYAIAHIKWCAQTIHQGHHQEQPYRWQECPRGFCKSNVDALGEVERLRAEEFGEELTWGAVGGAPMSRATETMARWEGRMEEIIALTDSIMRACHARGIPKDLLWAFLATGGVAWTQAEPGWTEQDAHELFSLLWSLDREPSEPEGASA